MKIFRPVVSLLVVATLLVARPAFSQDSPSSAQADYDAILKKYVKGDYFQYGELKKNAADLARFDRFLRWQATADVKKMPRAEQIAFYINAYNACCIKAILDNYPVHTPKDVAGFFDKLKFDVAGEKLTISQIEYDRLIANYKDMRAHFAVVCADRGCLPLKASAYTGKQLDADLEAAAKKFVSDERHFKVDKERKEIQISKIFEWYGPKFLEDPERPVKGKSPELYLTGWVAKDVRQLLESGEYKLKTIDWDWTLNEK
jgi:DNA-dependent RNA polymerase auxiliary subunit epsilon